VRRYISEIIAIVLWSVTLCGAVGVYWLIHAQESVAEELNRTLTAAEQAVAAGDWTVAGDYVRDVYTRWRHIERVWTLHTQHELLEDVTMTLLEAQALIDVHDEQAVAQLRRARHRLETLPRRDRLLLQNLL